jgi:hypothetical protein
MTIRLRKEARSALIQLASDDYYHSLIIEDGLVRVPLVGSSAYKAFRPLPHSWPSFPDGLSLMALRFNGVLVPQNMVRLNCFLA